MKEEKEPVVPAGTMKELKPDELVVLLVQGKVDEITPLGNTGMTEVCIIVGSVNGTPIILKDEEELYDWAPMPNDVAATLKEGDEVIIRVAMVKPTSTADDFIRAKVDQDEVRPLQGSQFADVSFFVGGIESHIGDGSFWVLLPTDEARKNKEICLRIELITLTPKSDETATDEPEQ